MKVLICGEAYGANEAQHNHPLVGASGHELVRLLNQAGLAPPLPGKFPPPERMIEYWRDLRQSHSIGVTNVFNKRPPGNQIEAFFGTTGDRTLPALKKGKYVLHEHLPELDRLAQEIKDARPNLIIALGNSACWYFLRTTPKISSIRGYVNYSHPDYGVDDNLPYVKVIPTYHPAFILRDWSLRTIVLKDLIKASREQHFPEIRRIPRHFVAQTPGSRMTLSEIKSWFNRPAERYAVDIETGYALYSKLEIEKMTTKMAFLISEQISMVSFARNEHDALIVPIMDRNEPGLSYWPPEDEIQVWRILRRALQTPVPKVFQNGIFDISFFLRLGIVPRACTDDTMLRHHAMFPELPKALGFLGSIYTEDISWKQAYGNRESFKRDE